jgi:short-subunit dehydrogenase
VVVPGYVRTELSEVAVGKSKRADMTKPDPVERGLPAERCAAAIVQAIRKDKAEIHIGGPEVAGIYVSRWFPGLLRRLAPRFAP